MKKFFSIIILIGCFLSGLVAQTASGEIKELSISPDSSVWLVSNAGIIYWTNNLKDDFKTILKLPEPKPDYFGAKHIEIERVLFFNKDSLFICGYVGNNLTGGDQGEPNMIYRSADKGKTWATKEFASDGVWIYNSLIDSQGKVWMGGSDGNIYFTQDYGNNWKKLSSPFNGSTRLACLGKGSRNGLVGSLMGNELKLSTDEFNKFRSLKTPLDQKAYSSSKAKDQPDPSDRFYRLGVIGDSIFIVNQQHHIFYSDVEKIKWQKVTPFLTEFCFDETSNKLIGLTEDNKIVSFQTNMKFEKEILTLSKDETVIDIKSQFGVIYILAAKYSAPKKGENVIGTVGGMQITRVGYKKVSDYVLYKIVDNVTLRLNITAH